jgi:hypothetical protein
VTFTQDAVTVAVARRMFTDQGRKLLAGNPASCTYAYLEQPSITFRASRIVLRVHLAARAGLASNGRCVGPSDAFGATLSGRPVIDGETIAVRDVRMDEGKPEYRSLLEPLLQRQLPALLGANLRTELARYLDSNISDFKMTVRDFRLQDVAAADGLLTVRFDFALQALPR